MSDDSAHVPGSAPPAADPQSVEGLFLSALGQTSAQEREAFLDEACGDDLERRRRVEALLRAYDDAGSFLEKPPLAGGSGATLSLDFLTPADDPGLLGMLGPYEVYEILGRGGMGIVFRARDPKLNRVVAIKVLAPELAANPNARRRFLREAQAAAAISHPHVVTIHAVDEGSTASRTPAEDTSRGVSALPFIVMECIVGQTLQQKIDKQGSLRLTEILRIGQQAAQGLAAAHKQGLIHRDIKPANILLENGIERVKITDFGLARAADDVSITRTGEVSGTPQYMSPEQAQGTNVDQRSDLFSLGCVLYAMCTGRSPFRATTLAASIRRVCDDEPRPIEEINAEIPGWLVEIINRLLKKDPEDRLQSAEDVEQFLGERLASIQHPSARPHLRSAAEFLPRPASSSRPTVRERIEGPLRILLWIAALLLLLPIFIAVGGTALGAGGDALEGAVIAAMVCIPAGLLCLAVALLDRTSRNVPYLNAIFILCCILLGPIGILLYLVRRDQYLLSSGNAPVAGHPEPEQASIGEPSSPEAARGSSAAAKFFASVLFVLAALLAGQAIEQWSDVSGEVGLCLFASAALLGLLAEQCRRTAHAEFSGLHWVIVALVALPLLFVGAQLPDQEFKQGLSRQIGQVAMATVALFLLGLPLSVLLWGRRLPDHREPTDSGWRRDDAGRALIVSSFLIWSTLVVWMLLVAADILPPPPFSARKTVASLVMLVVVSGGFCLGAGLLLQRRLLTPGAVRQVLTQSGSGGSTGGSPAESASRSSRPAPSPWHALGWMVVGLIVLIPGCFAAYLGLWWSAEAPNRVNPAAKDSLVVPSSARLLEEDGFPAMRTIPLLNISQPGRIRLLSLGDVEIGRVVVDGKDLKFERQENGDVEFAADGGHHDLQIVMQSGERYHVGAQVPFGGVTVVALPSAGPGLLRLQLSDPDLSVRLIPVYGGSDPVPLRRQGASSSVKEASESGTYQAPAGRYNLWISDHLAGWCDPDTEEPVAYSTDQIEVASGSSQKLTEGRNLNLVSNLFGGWSDYKLYGFRWNGVVYTLTRPQAQVVHRLLTAYVKETPEVDVRELLLATGQTQQPPSETIVLLKSLFDDGEHRAWNSLIVPGEGENSYRLPPLQIPGEKATAGTAIVNIHLRVHGLQVLLQPDDGSSVTERIDSDFSARMTPGRYRVLVEDEVAGWHQKDRFGETGPVRYEYATIQVKDGESVDLEVRRNLHRLSAARPQLHAGIHRFRWNGKSYELNAPQASAIAILLHALAEQTGDVHEATLLNGANFVGPLVVVQPMSPREAEESLTRLREQGHSLRAVFDDGENPAWESLIVEGEEPNTYRLPPLAASSQHDQARVNLVFKDPQLQVLFKPADGSRDEETADASDMLARHSGEHDGEVTLSPDEYRVLVEDGLAGWHTKTEFGETGPVRYEYAQLTLGPGRGENLTVSRNFANMAAASPDLMAEAFHAFRWQGRTYQLSQTQAIAVQHLLWAYARGSYELSEAECLRYRYTGHTLLETPMTSAEEAEYMKLMAENGRSLKGDFDDGEHPAWGRVIVEGENPNTFRLAELVPPDQESSTTTTESSPAGIDADLVPASPK